MDPYAEWESSQIDPDVPFHASSHHHHHTWAKTYHSFPQLYIQPRTTQEIRKVVTLAQRCRRRLVVVGCAHSPSDLTCTSSWMVNLDHYNKLLTIDKSSHRVTMQAGIRLSDLIARLKENGLAMPNLGSIDNQSIAGAFATATHGSSTRHGLLSQSVLSLKIMLANGRELQCAPDKHPDLFSAALVSLGALGIITEVVFQAVPAFKIQWSQSLHPLQDIISDWEKGLWSRAEFTRVWWLPYKKKVVRWRADKTDEDIRLPSSTPWTGTLGFHTYHTLLYISTWFPRILPVLESFVLRVQYGFTYDGAHTTAVQEGQSGLLMNCLYSQFVNEWAIPLERGPEALTRLSAWLHGDQETSRIPYDLNGIYVHAPIEVRVTDTSINPGTRPYLDSTVPSGPTLYLNATLYRPYNTDPPCRKRYYEAFEWLMKELGGRPHWAKNFSTVTKDEIHSMYPQMGEWLRVRHEVDPDGLFVGDWHRRLILPTSQGELPLRFEERRSRVEAAKTGGLNWFGQLPTTSSSPHSSEESFDMIDGAEAMKSGTVPVGAGETK
ncbi:D-arabinono-1,4-lactone oxidase [Xanthoria parietina]